MKCSIALIFILTAGLARLAWPRASAPAAALACPASIEVLETIMKPEPFVASPGRATRTLLTGSVLNVDGKDEFDLKPDDEQSQGAKTTLIWNLDDYRDRKLILRCSYRDTTSKLTIQLPVTVHHCSAVLTMDAKNRITGHSQVACK